MMRGHNLPNLYRKLVWKIFLGVNDNLYQMDNEQLQHKLCILIPKPFQNTVPAGFFQPGFIPVIKEILGDITIKTDPDNGADALGALHLKYKLYFCGIFCILFVFFSYSFSILLMMHKLC